MTSNREKKSCASLARRDKDLAHVVIFILYEGLRVSYEVSDLAKRRRKTRNPFPTGALRVQLKPAGTKPVQFNSNPLGPFQYYLAQLT